MIGSPGLWLSADEDALGISSASGFSRSTIEVLRVPRDERVPPLDLVAVLVAAEVEVVDARGAVVVVPLLSSPFATSGILRRFSSSSRKPCSTAAFTSENSSSWLWHFSFSAESTQSSRCLGQWPSNTGEPGDLVGVVFCRSMGT